jgi:iron complex outermembrane receptor protein
MPNGGHFYFKGNKNMDLLSMQMFEIGYRIKPAKKIQVDLEAFYTKTTDFSMFGMDSINIRVYMDGYDPGPPPAFNGEQQYFRQFANFSYKNSRVESHQLGLSFDIKTVLTEKLYLKIFGTIQQTQLKNHSPITTEQAGELMTLDAIMNNRITYDSMYTPSADPADWYLIRDYGGSYISDSVVNTNHTHTPSFYGGFEINYSPGKFNINASAYTYTKQTLTHSFETVDVDPKFIMNLKVSYKAWKENEVFINARNLLNNKTKEFGFTDDIGGTYLVGISINF